MIFKRKKNAEAAQDATAPGTTDPQDAAAGVVPQADEHVDGPFDADDFPDREGYIDLGALLIEPVEGMQLRLEVEDRTQRVVAVALELDGSRLQLQVFAAPKTEAVWPGIAEQIAAGIVEQGGRTDRVQGRFGEELVARVPSKGPDGTEGYMVARFIGIDGPRWFVRGVLGGPATLDRAAAERLEDRIARLIVVRGDKPMPPAELLPLTMPAGAVARPDQDPAPQVELQRPPTGPNGPERGPEITAIG
jgi:hypothetical protein